jgi:hypothetical protein
MVLVNRIEYLNGSHDFTCLAAFGLSSVLLFPFGFLSKRLYQWSFAFHLHPGLFGVVLLLWHYNFLLLSGGQFFLLSDRLWFRISHWFLSLDCLPNDFLPFHFLDDEWMLFGPMLFVFRRVGLFFDDL